MESRWEFCFLETCNRLHDKSQFIELMALSIFEEIIVRNTAPSVGKAALSLPSA